MLKEKDPFLINTSFYIEKVSQFFMNPTDLYQVDKIYVLQLF